LAGEWCRRRWECQKEACISGQVRRPNIIGNSSFLKGKVLRKYIILGEHLVDCEIRVENQSGLVTAPGTATVALVSKTALKPCPTGQTA
jgi:hypothetical protein